MGLDYLNRIQVRTGYYEHRTILVFKIIIFFVPFCKILFISKRKTLLLPEGDLFEYIFFAFKRCSFLCCAFILFKETHLLKAISLSQEMFRSIEHNTALFTHGGPGALLIERKSLRLVCDLDHFFVMTHWLFDLQ